MFIRSPLMTHKVMYSRGSILTLKGLYDRQGDAEYLFSQVVLTSDIERVKS
jgi:hypothetical protein